MLTTKILPPYFSPLLPVIVDAPGLYMTREGLQVEVTTITPYRARGIYPNGVCESWHKSGRIYCGQETINDIVSKIT